MTISLGQYRIDISSDPAYFKGSADNLTQYDFVYFDHSKYDLPSVYGIKCFQGDKLLRSAAIGSIGGGTRVHENSVIVEDNRIIICCADTIFCLSIPELSLIWQTKADTATCFEVFKIDNNYIVHGEVEITKLDKNGKIIWQNNGADIFTTVNGKDDFIITDKHIIATDWENRKYKFDFDGNLIS
jgi:outer membrane protein assembly factor BamB